MNEREHAVLSLFYDEGNKELTPSFLAYRMRITTRDATALLDGMVTTGTLDLHFDDQGNISYRLPPSEQIRIDRQRRTPSAQPRQSAAPHGPSPSARGASAYDGPQPPLRERPPGGVDATAGYADGSAGYSQPFQGAQPAHDGTDGSVRSARPVQWAAPQGPAPTASPAQSDQFYEDWYADGQAEHPGRPRRGQPRTSQNAYAAGPAPYYQGQGNLPDRQALTPYQSQGQLARAYYGPPGQRIPILAGALSLLLPGLGQFYNGEFVKGVMLPICCLFLMVFGLFWIVWIWSVIDAYMVAEQHNHRLLSADPQHPNPALLPDHGPPGQNPNSNAA